MKIFSINNLKNKIKKQNEQLKDIDLSVSIFHYVIGIFKILA